MARTRTENLYYGKSQQIEADGCFSDRHLEIVLHIDDIALAYRIKKWIGYGSVYKVLDKNAVKYSLRHREGLKKVLFLFIENHQSEQQESKNNKKQVYLD